MGDAQGDFVLTQDDTALAVWDLKEGKLAAKATPSGARMN
jgi:hypothetical protein